MPRRSKENRNTRTLTTLAGGKSYAVTLPIETLRAFGWEAGTELTIRPDDKNHRLIIERPHPKPRYLRPCHALLIHFLPFLA